MNWYYDVISRYYPYNFLLALLSPASDSLSSLDSKLRHSAYAHLRVARAQCVYGFIFSRICGNVYREMEHLLAHSVTQWTLLHPTLGRYSRWTRNCVTRASRSF